MRTINFIDLIREADGETSGANEITSTNVEQARQLMKDLNLYDGVKNFERNYKHIQKLANLGHTQRKDMPVIRSFQMKQFQKDLQTGTIDIHKPFSKDTTEHNPWPEGLSGKEAAKFVKNGFNDGQKPDDKIKISVKRMPVGNLKPIQRQIYMDKIAKGIAKGGIEKLTNFLQNETIFIASADNFIIDGHHR